MPNLRRKQEAELLAQFQLTHGEFNAALKGALNINFLNLTKK